MKARINIFDFDGTLTTETWPKFWTWVNKFGFDGTRRNNDLEKALTEYHEKNPGDFLKTFFGFFNNLLTSNNATLSKAELMDGEKYIKYNQGAEDYFKNSEEKNYIVSGGLLDFLQNLKISKYFDGIYGTKSIFDKNGSITTFSEIMTDENKTLAIQDILRINGRQYNDCTNVTFTGDGASDIASWRFVHNNGGKSIFVHQPAGSEDEWHNFLEDIYQKLNKEGVIDYKCTADYTPGSPLTQLLQSSDSKTRASLAHCLNK